MPASRFNTNLGQTTEEFYNEVIDKVLESMKDDFLQEGVSENTLNELKKSWK